MVEPIATLLFNVCSAVTVECCVLYPCCLDVFGMFAVKYGLFCNFILVCSQVPYKQANRFQYIFIKLTGHLYKEGIHTEIVVPMVLKCSIHEKECRKIMNYIHASFCLAYCEFWKNPSHNYLFQLWNAMNVQTLEFLYSSRATIFMGGVNHLILVEMSP